MQFPFAMDFELEVCSLSINRSGDVYRFNSFTIIAGHKVSYWVVLFTLRKNYFAIHFSPQENIFADVSNIIKVFNTCQT